MPPRRYALMRDKGLYLNDAWMDEAFCQREREQSMVFLRPGQTSSHCHGCVLIVEVCTAGD